MKTVYTEEKLHDDAVKAAFFRQKQALPYPQKIQHAKQRAWEFYEFMEGNTHVSVGGLDSITLLCFLRDIGIDCPAISASSLEDRSIQKIHKDLGVINVKPLMNKADVIREFGYPIISKETANKISQLQHPTENNKTVRHAIITGETGTYGGYRTGTRMKLSQKWLNRFGGADPEGAALGYQAAPFLVSDKCCYYLKEKPCDDWAREHKSAPYLGLMASEHGRREKVLMQTGCNYYGKSRQRSAPFAIFSRDDLLRLALDLDVPVPEIYGKIEEGPDGLLRTTGAQRTGCSMCGFGIHLEERPHRFDKLRIRNEKEWRFWMYDMGWGKVLDYCGIGWEDMPDADEPINGQMSMLEELI